MIKRILLIKCDCCGAEGPSIEGERRKELLQDAIKYAWSIDHQRHVCGECQNVKPTPVGPPIGGPIQPDRSVHWTEARKKESAQ